VTPRTQVADRFLAFVVAIVVAAALLLAWRSLRMHRGDRQGAFRFAAAHFAVHSVALLITISYPRGLWPLIDELWLLLGSTLLTASIVYLLYLALEPYARRKWPEHLIAWVRLLSGRVQDPLVGRDVLIGIVGGMAYALLMGSASIVGSWFTPSDPQPHLPSVYLMPGIRSAAGLTLYSAILGIRYGSVAILILVLATIVFRKRSIAGAVFFVINLAYFMLSTGGQTALVPSYAAIALILAYIALRFGLLAYAVLQMTFIAIYFGTAASPSWLLMHSAFAFATILALALWAFRTSLGGQSLIARGLFED
jgi:hypothetical protein